MRDDVSKKWTFMICGHAQVGKTSLADALLFKTQAVTRMGSVDEGTSVSDYEDDEKERKSSINLSVLTADYKKNLLQFIDLPGYLDFVGEVVSAAKAADFAIVVIDATSGVQVGTERVWDIIRREKLPCLFFITKLDKEETSFEKTLIDIKQTLTSDAAPLEAFAEGKIVNILENKTHPLYSQLVEKIAESNDELLAKYLEQGSLQDQELQPALKNAVLNGNLFPVIGGVPIEEKGIEALLDTIVMVMPSVAQALPRKAKDTPGNEIVLEAKVDAPFCAQVFKTVIDPFVGQLNIFRVFSGKLAANTEFFNSTQDSKEKIGQLYSLQGKQQIALDVACAGDICAVAKLKATHTADTLCHPARIVKLPGLEFPSPAYSASVKPKTRQDEEKISSALARLMSEDPTCRTSRDSQTKELILSGMGELHIHVIIDRMRRKYQADVDVGKPKVPYLETITKSIKVAHKYKKQTGGHGQYGDVSLEILPLERGKEFEFVDNIVGGAIPRNFIPSVEKGVRKAMETGILAGYPVKDIRVILFDGSYHDVDSSDMAFQIAASLAFKEALEKAGPVLLEPIMNVEVAVPEVFMGQITGDINAKRGRVMGMDTKGKNQVVKATIPLVEMFQYASDLKSVTGGRGSYSMSFSHYDIVPPRLAQGIIAESKKEQQQVKASA